MADAQVQKSPPAGVPAPPPDDENEALIDAYKTFKYTILTAVPFVASALVIILLTRMR